MPESSANRFKSLRLIKKKSRLEIESLEQGERGEKGVMHGAKVGQRFLEQTRVRLRS